MNNHNLDSWIFDSFAVSPQGLGLFRITFALFTLFFLMPDPSAYRYLASLPADFYAPPPGPMMLFSNFPSELFLWCVHGLLILALIFLLIGYQTKTCSVLTGILFLILKGFIFSIGKINHELLIAVVPVVMAFSNWSAAFSVDATFNKTHSRAESWPLTLLALIIGFMMFTAGFPKIMGGWLDPATQAAEGHFLNQFLNKERQALLAVFFFDRDMSQLWELLDWATIVFEVGFLLSVVNSKWFRLFVGFAVIFHFSTLIILNISFLVNYIAYAAFLNWDKVFLFIRNRAEKTLPDSQLAGNRFPVIFGIALLVTFTTIKFISGTDMFLEDSELTFYDFFFSASALFIILFLGTGKIKYAIEAIAELKSKPILKSRGVQ